MTPSQQLVQDIAAFHQDPLGFIRYAYPWGEPGELEDVRGPRDWQRDILDLIGRHLRSEHRYDPLRIAVASGHGVGKAQRPSDTVPTPSGKRLVRDCKAGDYLFGEDGKPVLIRATRFYESCPFYRVTFSDGTSVEVSSGHLWKTRDRQARRNGTGWKVVSTQDIVGAGVLRPNGVAMARQWEIPASKAVQYDHRLLPVDPYTYGVWLGDGDKASGRITNIDPEVWEQVAYPFRGTGKTRTLLGLKMALRKAGLFGCTTYNACVDRKYIESAERLAVLQGLLDTDGWVEVSGGAAFASASRQLTIDVIELARSLGLRARNESFKPNDHAGSWQTHITWDGFTQLFRIVRKQKKLIAAESRYTAKWIDSIEPVESGEGICFEVDGGLYQTGEFILTHNSALIGMVCGWGMSCYPDCRINITANTGKQLDTKTWPEMAIWFRRLINAKWFRFKGESITIADKAHEETWRIDAVPWSENNPAAFAGLHNKRKIVILIMDEASEIPYVVWETSEGALTDEETILIFLAFGNPTQNSGAFAECFGKNKHRWKHYHVDSRKVEGTNKKLLDEWVADYGEDSDFVRVRVRGEFPRAGSTQFIAGDVVAAARKRVLEPNPRDWKILSVDVARFGDDQTVIGIRQGDVFRILSKMRGMDTTQVAMHTMMWMERETPRMTVIDGDGIGGGVADYIKLHNADWFKKNAPCRMDEFHGGNSPGDGFMYFNRRAEMWGKMRHWLETADIPDDPELAADLTGPEYFFSAKNQIQLEKKEDMKKRGLASPDAGDCLAQTFSAVLAPQTREEKLAEEIAACPDPLERHFMRLRETERRNKASAPLNFWE